MFSVGGAGCLVLGLSATIKRNDGLTHVMHWFLGNTAFSADRDAISARDVVVRMIEVGGRVLCTGSAVDVVSALAEDERRSCKLVQQALVALILLLIR